MFVGFKVHRIIIRVLGEKFTVFPPGQSQPKDVLTRVGFKPTSSGLRTTAIPVYISYLVNWEPCLSLFRSKETKNSRDDCTLIREDVT